ncbi:MAG: ribosomal protein S18-alanine N-acetyltransferase [Gemmatimonadota bacterium]|nr:ribosomal protein S18-alanine N-acetyltransferase [Gemmatimonadota bacterium]
MAGRCQIRTAHPADAPLLGLIERACFADPWTDRSLVEAIGSGQGISLLATNQDGVVGYLLARHAGGSGEILNLAVAPEGRRRGVGRDLLEEALRQLSELEAAQVFLEVRGSNAAALALYQGRGFRIVGSRRGYYRLPEEDALVLRLDCAPSA